MPVVVVRLNIPADEFVRLYSGDARYVVAQTEQGHTVQFPAERLVPYVSRDGVIGRFAIEYGDDRRFRSIRRLDDRC